MSKQDQLLIYRGEMISEIADEGYLGEDKIQEFKTFMEENFATTDEVKAFVYIEVVNAIAISKVEGDGLETSLENMLSIFEMTQSKEDIIAVMMAVKSINSASYTDAEENINLLKVTTSGIPHLDLTRARMLLSVAIANNEVDDIRTYTTLLRECSEVVQAQKDIMTWESQDV